MKKTKQTAGRAAAAGCGFTLIEVLIASILIGIAVAALLASNSSFTFANAGAIDLSTAEYLVEEIRELTAQLPLVDPQSGTSYWGKEAGETQISQYDDLDDFDSASVNPPVDINRAALGDFAVFTQKITVQNVQAGAFGTAAAHHASDFVRVTVSIEHNGKSLTSASWIRAKQ